jgi:hypothetical protein
MPASSYPPTPATPPNGLSAVLVDAGNGTLGDYLGLDARGKVAFVRFDTDVLPWLDTLAYEAELQGACALVFYYVNGYAQHESGRALNTHDGMARTTIPVLQICRRDGGHLAERLTAGGSVRVTLRSQVEADPKGTGHNIVGELPGRLRDRYLIIGAHYDAWFHGYWDNAVGVAGMLAMAKALLKSGYQPEHTLLFVATDAEEFGVPDTHFDWLIGCHRMLEDHPQWHEGVSAAFNIDTLGFLDQEQLGFISSPELLPFVRCATSDYSAEAFPTTEVRVKEQITAWTEVLSYAYFGIPPLQPRFGLKEAKRTVYHTQFDDAGIVHVERAFETIRLYGALLVRFDCQTILPYEFTERVQTLRRTIENPPPGVADGELAGFRRALDTLEQRSQRLNRLLSRMDEVELDRRRKEINNSLSLAAGHMIKNTNYLSAEDPEDALPLHIYYDRDLRALDAALVHLETGEAQKAIAVLADDDTGLHGAWYAAEMSYPVYYRQTIGARDPARQDLFWGKDRTAAITDVWMELHTLRDKLERGVSDFRTEERTLREKRQAVAARYREAIASLTTIVEEVAELLPPEGLQGIDAGQ